jgi:hypothetical protein
LVGLPHQRVVSGVYLDPRPGVAEIETTGGVDVARVTISAGGPESDRGTDRVVVGDKVAVALVDEFASAAVAVVATGWVGSPDDGAALGDDEVAIALEEEVDIPV